jgi:hypothetical protein
MMVVDELPGLLDPFTDDLFVCKLLGFESLCRLELFEGNQVQKDQAKAEDI